MNSPTNKHKLAARDKEVTFLNLRRQGFRLSEIARRHSCSVTTVHNACKRALQQLNAEIMESAAECRRLELERLDEYLTKLGPAIRTGDVKAVNAAVRICDRRSKLLGLDTPANKSDADDVQKFAARITPLIHKYIPIGSQAEFAADVEKIFNEEK